MNPGDKVRVTNKELSIYDKVGVFEKWNRYAYGATPTMTVKFGDGIGRLDVDAWDLELVEEPYVGRTCDQTTTSGRRFVQEHSCIKDTEHTGPHYCNVCGFTWPTDAGEEE